MESDCDHKVIIVVIKVLSIVELRQGSILRHTWLTPGKHSPHWTGSHTVLQFLEVNSRG